MTHVVKITGSGRPEGGDFKWVNTGLGNVKSAITGTLRSCDPQHAPRLSRCFRMALQSPLRIAREPRPARPSGGHHQASAAAFNHRDPHNDDGKTQSQRGAVPACMRGVAMAPAMKAKKARKGK
jgi:hypothetical protein